MTFRIMLSQGSTRATQPTGISVVELYSSMIAGPRTVAPGASSALSYMEVLAARGTRVSARWLGDSGMTAVV